MAIDEGTSPRLTAAQQYLLEHSKDRKGVRVIQGFGEVLSEGGFGEEGLAEALLAAGTVKRRNGPGRWASIEPLDGSAAEKAPPAKKRVPRKQRVATAGSVLPEDLDQLERLLKRHLSRNGTGRIRTRVQIEARATMIAALGESLMKLAQSYELFSELFDDFGE